MAYDCLASGATYPTLYNDDVNVDAVAWGMRLPKEIAEQYVPFGCTEFVIQGKSVGTPNTLLNLLKILQLALNEGRDPMDGIYKAGPVEVKPLDSFKTFDEFYDQYKALLDYYFDLSIDAQKHSYEIMNQEVSFLFTSILMDDCLARGKALLDGGVELHRDVERAERLDVLLQRDHLGGHLREAQQLDRLRDLGGVDGPVEGLAFAHLRADRHGRVLERVGELRGGVQERLADLLLLRLDLRDPALRAFGDRLRQALRHEEVAGVAVRDLHDVAGQAELVDVGGE